MKKVTRLLVVLAATIMCLPLVRNTSAADGQTELPITHLDGQLPDNGSFAVNYIKELDIFNVIHYESGTNYMFDRTTGKPFKPGEYNDVSFFSEGLAVAAQREGSSQEAFADNAKYGYIDRNGAVVIPFEFDIANDFHDGLALVAKRDVYGYIRYGIIDKTGAEVVPIEYEVIYPFSDGLAMVSRMDEAGGELYGYVDKTGAMAIPLEPHCSADDFSYGLAMIAEEYPGTDGDTVIKRGYIDKTGAVAVPVEYDYAVRLYDGYACVGKLDSNSNMKYGYIDSTGKVVVPLEYDYALTTVRDGFAWVGKRDANGGLKYGYINMNGVQVTPLKYDQFESEETYLLGFSEGFAPIMKRGANGKKYGFIDRNGTEVVPPKYDLVYPFLDGRAAVAHRDATGAMKYGFLDGTGAEVVPLVYDRAESFQEGLALVVKNEGGVPKYCFIDKDGNVAFYAQYDEVASFSQGFARVTKKRASSTDAVGYIDKTGMEVVPPEFEDVIRITTGSDFSISDRYFCVVNVGSVGIAERPANANANGPTTAPVFGSPDVTATNNSQDDSKNSAAPTESADAGQQVETASPEIVTTPEHDDLNSAEPGGNIEIVDDGSGIGWIISLVCIAAAATAVIVLIVNKQKAKKRRRK